MDDTKKVPDKISSTDFKSNDNEFLRRQIKVLEEKLRRQRPAEKPYEANVIFFKEFYLTKSILIHFLQLRLPQHKSGKKKLKI